MIHSQQLVCLTTNHIPPLFPLPTLSVADEDELEPLSPRDLQTTSMGQLLMHQLVLAHPDLGYALAGAVLIEDSSGVRCRFLMSSHAKLMYPDDDDEGQRYMQSAN